MYALEVYDANGNTVFNSNYGTYSIVTKNNLSSSVNTVVIDLTPYKDVFSEFELFIGLYGFRDVYNTYSGMYSYSKTSNNITINRNGCISSGYYILLGK